MATKIRGIEGMKHGELDFEIQRGGKFVLFQYCVSVVVLTFRRPSDIYFVRSGENTVVKGLPFTLVSLVAGWWGIRGDRFTQFSPSTTIRAAARTSRRPLSIRSERQRHQHRQFLQKNECTKFRACANSGKL